MMESDNWLYFATFSKAIPSFLFAFHQAIFVDSFSYFDKVLYSGAANAVLSADSAFSLWGFHANPDGIDLLYFIVVAIGKFSSFLRRNQLETGTVLTSGFPSM